MTDVEDPPASNVPKQGAFERDARYINDHIVSWLPAGSEPVDERTREPVSVSGDQVGHMAWPVEAGRYRLMAARACPWAHRTIITRRLLGLEDALSLSLASPTHGAKSWNYRGVYPGDVDPVLGVERLQAAYFERVPDYPRGITVPAIAEISSGKVVTNNFHQIVTDFIDEWAPLHREGAPDLYPADQRERIDALDQLIYRNINNGVYRCGFAASQDAYDRAYAQLWAAMDQVTEILSKQRYLVGDHITLADVRLFPTLVRFDAVYHGHFKCNRQKLTEIEPLWGYLRDLFQTPGFGDTVDFEQIKQHYYVVHHEVNPTGVVPLGPDLSNLLTPHGREALGGSPFGDGTAPGPNPAGEEPTPGTNPLFPALSQ